MEKITDNKDSNIEKIADTEAEIMKVIWSKGCAVTYSEIRAALNEKFDWGGQVINTMLKRLVNKGVLAQEKRDVYYYTSLVAEEDYRKAKTMSLVHKVYEGNAKGLISALISYADVTPEDFEDLRRFWKEEKKENE